MKSDTKRQLVMWGAGVAIAALFFGPSVRQTVQQVMFMNRARPPVKPSPMKPAQPDSKSGQLDSPGATAASNSAVAYDRILGMWEGRETLPIGLCTMKFELRKKPDQPASFSGFPVITCIPLVPPILKPNEVSTAILASLNPVSATLTGTPGPNSIQFTVDKLIGPPGDCALTSFTVTPFGSDQIAAEWQEGTCRHGQMLLRRTGR